MCGCGVVECELCVFECGVKSAQISQIIFHFFVVLPVVFGSSLGVSHKDIPESLDK